MINHQTHLEPSAASQARDIGGWGGGLRSCGSEIGFPEHPTIVAPISSHTAYQGPPVKGVRPE